MLRAFLNPAVDRSAAFRGLFTEDDYQAVEAFFDGHPELDRHRCDRSRSWRRCVGVRRVEAKDESHRFGLNAFKIVGVRYAATSSSVTTLRAAESCARPRATTGGRLRASRSQTSIPCTVFIPRGAASRRSRRAQVRDARVNAMKADAREGRRSGRHLRGGGRAGGSSRAGHRRGARVGHVVGWLRADPALDHGGLHADLRRSSGPVGNAPRTSC